MGSYLYFVKEAVRGFYQAKLMTSLSILTIALSLFILGIAAIGTRNLNAIFEKSTGQVDVIAYLNDTWARDTVAVQELLSQIQTLSSVKHAVLVSKADAWKRFGAQYGTEMQTAVDDNPLPASFEIELTKKYRFSNNLSPFVAQLKALGGIEEVRFSAEWFSKRKDIRRYLIGGAVFLVVLCFLILHFIVSNTIKLTIYARRELVINMRFVGATDQYIRAPFILEGMLQGLIGALLAAAGLEVTRFFLARFLVAWGPWYLAPALLVVGIAFGWSGSRSAVKKFLK